MNENIAENANTESGKFASTTGCTLATASLLMTCLLGSLATGQDAGLSERGQTIASASEEVPPGEQARSSAFLRYTHSQAPARLVPRIATVASPGVGLGQPVAPIGGTAAWRAEAVAGDHHHGWPVTGAPPLTSAPPLMGVRSVAEMPPAIAACGPDVLPAVSPACDAPRAMPLRGLYGGFEFLWMRSHFDQNVAMIVDPLPGNRMVSFDYDYELMPRAWIGWQSPG